MTQNNLFADMPVIHAYTRAQAIEDGVLVDLSAADSEVREVVQQHYKLPLACTEAVWNLIEHTVADNECMDDAGIVHDLLWMSRVYARPDRDTVRFPCIVGEETRHFKLVIGPGDEAEPVLTLMFIDED